MNSSSDASERKRELPERERAEYAIATRVSRQTLARMVTADLLILNGLRRNTPTKCNIWTRRSSGALRASSPTILLTPEQPHELAADVTRLADHGAATWERINERLYSTNLIACSGAMYRAR